MRKILLKKKNVIIRNPNSTRPWQHVLEVVYGYLTLGSKLYKNPNLHGEVFNFGPNKRSNYKVIFLLKKIKKYWPNFKWKVKRSKKDVFESKLLKLNSDKAKRKLNWQSKMNIDQSAKLVADWYSFFYKKKTQNFINYQKVKLILILINLNNYESCNFSWRFGYTYVRADKNNT